MLKRKYQNKKWKKQKRTILFYGEGADEDVFLRYLNTIYGKHNINLRIKIKNGSGGAPDMVVKKAINYYGDFDARVVIIDTDRPKIEIEAARKMAKDSGVFLIENNPCLEALLLRILNVGKIIKNKKSEYYKKEFEKGHICERKRCNVDEYKKIFPKNILDNKRKEIEELNKIIGFMESKKLK
ncbi:MAG: hypothetical protein UR60_C0021G0020 [Candidatus Moranbacteria bacterium GW2011_GWF2_34_56]|nr:MAG: hypothetical protein UR51_C0008G0013 [Candidatus Moranbacteria bacterium GW2011_GWF1_34_10]KKP64452.1 MAG: hypothetical protein UR60_C0021G0020 [Candidatus Moranbacteria bacterium GW2011_GWF2_34_56]HBI17100.1 hypothetical protein [Candidatus Moranbacteria bacterium]